MAKEPGERYATAADLAADLRRYLAGEPLLARPQGRLVLFWRKCRRRPLLAGLAAALVVVWVLGSAGVTWQWRRAEMFRRNAEAGLDEAKNRRRQAVLALDQTRQTLWALVPYVNQRLIDDADARGDRQAFRDLVLKKYMSELRKSPSDPSLQRHQADTAFVLATLTELVASPSDALQAYQEAERCFEGLVHADAADRQTRASLARCLGIQGLLLLRTRQDAQARERLEEALAQWAIYIDPANRRGAGQPSRRTMGEACYAIERGLAELEQRGQPGRGESRAEESPRTC